ncbi:MAG: hypothetical protein OEM04_09200, partial [Flavobacteriaceae bacterium]|nr:hypothetical protein [Flavobacteriaceae bacterium]
MGVDLDIYRSHPYLFNYKTGNQVATGFLINMKKHCYIILFLFCQYYTVSALAKPFISVNDTITSIKSTKFKITDQKAPTGLVQFNKTVKQLSRSNNFSIPYTSPGSELRNFPELNNYSLNQMAT